MAEAVIVSTARSPIGKANKGSLKDMRPDDLTAQMVQAALDKVPALDPHDIDDLILGCGLPGGESGNNMGRIVAVLLGLDDVPGTERIYPAKIFELMYLGRPCLTLAPPGALAELCARHRLGAVLAPREEVAIAAHLAEVLRRFRAGDHRPRADAVDTERYHRRFQAGQFAAVFARAIEAARP